MENKIQNKNFETELNPLTFKWVTKDRQVFLLHEMNTSHIFNSMKMLYNHLATIYDMPTFWFNQKYSDLLNTVKGLITHASKLNSISCHTHKFIAEIIILFIIEIEKRGDLPEKYKSVFESIVNTLKIHIKRGIEYEGLRLSR